MIRDRLGVAIIFHLLSPGAEAYRGEFL
jgi:hypothetical protein